MGACQWGWEGHVSKGWEGHVSKGWEGHVSKGWEGHVSKGWEGHVNKGWEGWLCIITSQSNHYNSTSAYRRVRRWQAPPPHHRPE